MGGVRNPQGKSAKVVHVAVDAPRLKEENRRLKEELHFARKEKEDAYKALEESKKIPAFVTKAGAMETVPAHAHQELVNRHNEILKEYGKLRGEIVKGVPLTQMKALEPRVIEKEVIKEVEVLRIQEVLNRKMASALAVGASVVGFGLGALIF